MKYEIKIQDDGNGGGCYWSPQYKGISSITVEGLKYMIREIESKKSWNKFVNWLDVTTSNIFYILIIFLFLLGFVKFIKFLWNF